MSADIPTIEPLEIRAGDTLSWKKSLPDYPANDSWVLFYRLINQSAKHDISTSASGADHLAAATATATASYAPGEYNLIGWVTKGAERYSIPSKKVNVLPNLAVFTTGYDTRTTARKTLDLLNTALEAHGSNAWIQEYTINERTMKFKSVSEFMAFRSRMQYEVNREENAERIKSGLASKNKIMVRM